MDTERLKEVAPHYVVMLLLIFLIPALIRNVVGELSFWVELAIVFAVVFIYRPLVVRLGVGPSAWE